MENSLLQVRHLQTYFSIEGKTRKAVDDVSFSVGKGQIVCIVGESGCGKSVTALSLMRLVDEPGRIMGGQVLFDNQDILKLNEKQIQNFRGKSIGMVFQEPMHSLDPVFTIGTQITETIETHMLCGKKEARSRGEEWLKRVGLPNVERIMESYPHELSGGMLQRASIAIALCCEPRLLIADEPTTALDVTIQAQILELLRTIKEQTNMSILFITHDLGVVAELADYVLVMYAGKVIEEAPVLELFSHPSHPYTQGLLKSRPTIGQRKSRLYSIKGQVPDLSELPHACYFEERCEQCLAQCHTEYPSSYHTGHQHRAACWLYQGEETLHEPSIAGSKKS